ncbi:hypothetical protein BCU12_13160 [Vibrio sp. 10N.261.55.A7]|nr:hypothetical protein BCU12_13160 [Vibrio sp. 10N.261.55.A7]
MKIESAVRGRRGIAWAVAAGSIEINTGIQFVSKRKPVRKFSDLNRKTADSELRFRFMNIGLVLLFYHLYFQPI